MVAYKREGYDMFETMIAAIQDETVRRIYITRVKERVERKALSLIHISLVQGAAGQR